ncbi:PilN domain-containing protein [Desulfopila inferna]|uniref:PilN domain-containing protein n=1 Tax=Desulfopila inferna TaxID=468528 RepID=UPI001963456A|nr:PilN domain-containing protein [Desulfopila inferna]MBM9606221.1 PilN domain-containing protein [Desulfopila inferna]
MLRINLLPIRQLKKRAKARNQIIGFGMVFGAVLLALGFIGLLQVNRIETVQAAIAELQQEQNRLAPIIAEVDRLEKQKKDLQNKIDIIKKLRRESSLTVHVMDEVAKIIDNDRMWLKSFSQQGGSLQLSGIALDNQTVAQFMEALKESQFIINVNLSSSTLSKVSNRDFKSFALSCSVGFPQEPANDVAQQ